MHIPGLHLASEGSDLDALPWRATSYEGIEWVDLAPTDASEPRSDSQTVLIRMAAGRGYPAHRHIGPEDVLVLAGGYRDGDGRAFEAGQFVRYPAGSVHSPVALGEVGGDTVPCVLFAVAHGGTEVVNP